MQYFCLPLAESEVYNLGAKVPVKSELEIKGYSFALQKKAELTVNTFLPPRNLYNLIFLTFIISLAQCRSH